MPNQCETYGDNLEEEAQHDTTRIYIQNLNGLRWDEDGGRWPFICNVLASMQVDVACFSELNTDTNKYKVRTAMESICQRHFQQSRLVAATTSHTTRRAYKPGGTAILACNNITTQIKSHSRDRMGRWSSLAFTAATQTIRIISAYQVCQYHGRGTTTASSQQEAQLIVEHQQANHSSRLSPRQAFIQDLQAFISHSQALKEAIILTGDFNEAIHEQQSGMRGIANTCGLVDLFASRLGSPEIPSTYQRGSKRIDYVLISPVLLPHITAAGYEPFGYRIPSDHRGMYIDFSTDALFQHTIAPLAPIQKREFSSKNPGVVNKYVIAKMRYLNDHRFYQRLEYLLSQEVPNNELAESLDRDFQRAAAHAAKICTRKSRPPWSPKLAEKWATLHFYRMARSANRTTADFSPAISKLQEQWSHLPRAIPSDLQTIDREYKAAIHELKSAQTKARELRDEYLLQQSGIYYHNGEHTKAKVLQQMLQAETKKRVYDKLRYIRKDNQESAGLSQIKVPIGISPTDTQRMKNIPDTVEYWETITTPQHIETILLSRNRHHFGQAKHTPFASPPLQMEVGYKADGLIVDLILSGQVNSARIPQAAKLLVQHMQNRSATLIDEFITPEQILGKLKRWDESTTTSPSGIHLGHYHCMWRSPTPTDDEDQLAQIKQGQKALLQATADLMNYAIRHRYAYHRWTKIVNTMLQKEAGNPRVNRLRVIHIYEADYNLLLAVKWRQCLHHAEDQGLLNDGLYGSRPGRTAHDPVLLEVLQHEVYRMSMKAGINFDLDATSCYDRILANVASICSRRVGMPQSIALVNAETLEKASYHLKTNLGVSAGSYTHCSEYPIHGTGQGSGNSPAIWCFVCSALFDATATVTTGANFTSYSKHHDVHIFMIGFVDDCTQRANQFHNDVQPDEGSLVKMMEHDAQQWNNVLWASGGALEQTKCSYHLIQSTWNADGQPFLRGGTYAAPISLHDGTRTNLVYQKSSYESHKTLGCFINPAHSNTSTWLATRRKNDQFTRLVESNHLSRPEAWTLYTAIYLPSITYPIPMSPLTKQQCNSLNSTFLRALLPRLGYNRNIATALRYTPQSMGGVGLKHLYHIQGLQLLQNIYKYLNSPKTTIGKMLRIAISWTQAFLGISIHFLTDVHQPIPPCGNSLLLDLRQFLKTINAKLNFSCPSDQHKSRTNDRFIMDIAMNQSRWNHQQLIQINSCRRYLQALTLADISIITGTRLTQNANQTHSPPSASILRVSRFNQRRPGPRAWTTWTKFLRTISTKDGILYQRLGPWTVSHANTRSRQPFVYDPQKQILYTHHDGDLYRLHTRIGPNHYAPTTSAHPTVIQGYPTSVIQMRDQLCPVKDYIVLNPPPVMFNPSTETYHPPWQEVLLAGIKNVQPIGTIVSHIRRGNIITCSDGSASRDKASYGFVASTLQGLRLATGNGPAPGTDNNSFRSEAFGMLATMVWAQAISQKWIRSIPCEVTWYHYLDNQSVIKRVESSLQVPQGYPNSVLLPEQDVIKEIVAIILTLPWKVELKWVKGHQDSSAPIHQLPLEAQLNCQADRQASQYEASSASPATSIQLPHTPCQLVILGNTITRAIQNRVYRAATNQAYHKYLCQRFDWNTQVIDTIDWEIYTTLINRHRHRWPTTVKHLHDISPTGHIAHRNNSSLPHHCPACNSPFENNHHVLTCPGPSRAKWRTNLLRKLQLWDDPRSDPTLIDILQAGLRQFFQASQPSVETYPAVYHNLILEQNRIGWHQLFKARWSKQWIVHQQAYHQKATSPSIATEGKKWITQIGHLLLHSWHEIWQVRNNERHGQEHQHREAFMLHVVTAELQELYQLKNDVCPSDRHLFYSDAAEHLQRHPNLQQIEDWIHLYRDAIRASVSTAKRLGIHRSRNLLDYPMFNPAIRPGQQASLTAGSSAG